MSCEICGEVWEKGTSFYKYHGKILCHQCYQKQKEIGENDAEKRNPR